MTSTSAAGPNVTPSQLLEVLFERRSTIGGAWGVLEGVVALPLPDHPVQSPLSLGLRRYGAVRRRTSKIHLPRRGLLARCRFLGDVGDHGEVRANRDADVPSALSAPGSNKMLLPPTRHVLSRTWGLRVKTWLHRWYGSRAHLLGDHRAVLGCLDYRGRLRPETI